MVMKSSAPIIYVVEPFGGSIRRHNPTLPMVYWDDAAVTRGDGVFETLLVRQGRAANFERHMDRFRSSAELMDLPDPGVAQWAEATEAAVAEWTAQSDEDARCVWTYTRGRESTGIPSAWLTVRSIDEQVVAQRSTGIKVMTAHRGYSLHTEDSADSAEPPAPWLIVGAKTLSYAANMAALRYARAQGFDDVIYLDPDTGKVLEGATSTVVTVRKGGKLRTPTPGPDILPGTTQAALFDYAERHGWRCKTKDITMDRLYDAESVWLVSSVRVATRITHLDGVKLPVPSHKEEAEIRELMDKALGR
ncbi:aminodeoxychorismate lyase [Corynebacterium testudinoris]|uniref:Branched-chain amino acid aminotransferase/4-amino-4-deoxychorismate lyase n=2 Tax=Corynebacterium testudinoris TaxID=136857 RepID=A0A0G3HEU9_9CORY|nr:branched-chain amino acid aminotransferase/4-amino-4-deoxychorismate lyase [Corynebacterium testudinoris]MBX8996347.1 aminodeoxychorismate lyase [Corynebacterium testudinoris]